MSQGEAVVVYRWGVGGQDRARLVEVGECLGEGEEVAAQPVCFEAVRLSLGLSSVSNTEILHLSDRPRSGHPITHGTPLRTPCPSGAWKVTWTRPRSGRALRLVVQSSCWSGSDGST